MGGMPPAFSFSVGCLNNSESWSGESLVLIPVSAGAAARAYAAVTMARVARLSFENCLAFRGERVGKRHIGGSEGCGGKLGLERLADILLEIEDRLRKMMEKEKLEN